MIARFRAWVWQENHWYIAQCQEPDVATQGGSEDETLHNLAEALQLHFQPPVAQTRAAFAPAGAKRCTPCGHRSTGLTAARAQLCCAGGGPPLGVPARAAARAVVPLSRPLSFGQVRFKLEAAGFAAINQKGNHAKFIKQQADRVVTAILPHYTELAVSTILSILRQAKITPEKFDKL